MHRVGKYILYNNDSSNKWKNHFYEMKGDVGISHILKRKETRRCIHHERKSFITLCLPCQRSRTRSYLSILKYFLKFFLFVYYKANNWLMVCCYSP